MMEKLSREAWATIGLILLLNIVSIASSGFFLIQLLTGFMFLSLS
jgi:uncharacterized membrane protein